MQKLERKQKIALRDFKDKCSLCISDIGIWTDRDFVRKQRLHESGHDRVVLGEHLFHFLLRLDNCVQQTVLRTIVLDRNVLKDE